MLERCEWANASDLEAAYHDAEWGVPVHDDRLLFEMLILESAQSGLSWATILQKREGYLRAFDGFDVEKIATYSEQKITDLLNDKGIVRNKLKILATIENAKQVLELRQTHGSFDAYIWSFVDGTPIQNHWENIADVPSSTALSETMSKALKKKGFKFVGPTTCYSFMQAVGMVNDHLVSCFRHAEIKTMSTD